MFSGGGILIIMLVLASMACGLSELASGTPEEVVKAESPQTSEGAGSNEEDNQTVAAQELVTESATSPEQAAETDTSQIDPIIIALAERYDGETAFIAVAAAMERGYTFEQIATASIAGRLEANGNIMADDNTIVTPDGPPAGVLDLTNLQVKRNKGALLHPAAKPFVQELQSATWLLQGLEGLSGSSETVADEETELLFVSILLSLNLSGYTLDQIVEAIVLGYPITSTRSCAFFQGDNGRYVRPNQYNEVCYRDLPDNAYDPDSPLFAGEAPEVVAEEGDLALFCRIYEEFSADVKRSVEAYSEAVGNCFEDCSAGEILEDMEIRMDGYIDQLAEVARPQIKETMTQLAAETVVGISSTEEGRPELEPQLVVMDNYAGDYCGISFIGE
jgi:hypothetical protein